MKTSQSKLSKAALVLLASTSTSIVMAQSAPILFGGGASFDAPLISQESMLFPAIDGSLVYAPSAAGSASEAGLSAFLSNDAALLSLPPFDTIHFGSSSAPLTAAQLAAYHSGLGMVDGPLIQIPYLYAPVAITLASAPFGTGPTLPGSTAPTVALNDDDLCGIFSGKLINWNQVLNPDTGLNYPNNAPLTVVYHGNGSGTTDLLTRHLAAVCTVGNTEPGVTFHETTDFAGSTSAIFTTSAPANFVMASSSSNVVATLHGYTVTGKAAISYLSPDWTNTFLAPSSAPAAAAALPVASLRNSFTSLDMTPTAVNATVALSHFTPPPPLNAGNQLNWAASAAVAANPTTGYPISGTAQLIVSQCYANPGSTSPTPTQTVIDFISDHYTNPTFTSLVRGHGFDTVSASFQTAIILDFLMHSSVPLNIGNPTVCTGSVTGR